MPKFTGSIGLANYNAKAARRALDKELTEILIEGTRAWVRTVAAIIPNWSGESRASLIKIADKVGVPIFVTVAKDAPDRRAQGETKGRGDFEITGRGVYNFFWESNVFHLAYNEFNDATLVGFHLKNPGPYHSQRQAKEAFFRTVDAKLRALNADNFVSPFIKVVSKRI